MARPLPIFAINDCTYSPLCPQCYLRDFATAATSRLSVVDGAARRIFETTHRNVATERDFNRIDAKGFALDALE